MTDAPDMRIEVAFALPGHQEIISLTVPRGTTAGEAVKRANLPARFPQLPSDTFTQADLGVFGKRLRDPDAHVLQAGERVEIYRPLRIDPKQARIQRAARSAR
ncbi:MAG: RnfH family protein [Halomonas sp.]|nr:RnfH family protein [Halomonas sp.]